MRFYLFGHKKVIMQSNARHKIGVIYRIELLLIGGRNFDRIEIGFGLLR